MSFEHVIKGGQVVAGGRLLRADVGINGETIAAVGLDLNGDRVTDASGALVLPGGVDPHAHIEQLSGMGLMNADTFETASAAALLGGTTTVISFAAQAKGQSLSGALADYIMRSARGAMIDHAFHLSISDPTVEDFDEDLRHAVTNGHRSIKVFTTYDIGLGDPEILHILGLARETGALLCIHAENDGLIGFTKARLLNQGMTAARFHPPSHPRLAEIEAVERMIRFAEFFDHPVMLFHISTTEALEAIRAAKGRGVPVWAETCPHYLMMTEAELDKPGQEGAKWMCSPPQRDGADQPALWRGLALGDLSLVSSDHAPYRYDEGGKLLAGPDATFAQMANGLPGLQTRAPLMFDAMEDPVAFAELTATAPARIYGLALKGAIAPGLDADLVLWDPEASLTYGADDLADNVNYNPWEGRTIKGLPVTVIRRGETVVSDGTVHATPGSGRWQKRDRIGVSGAGRPAPELSLIEGAKS